MAAINQDTSLLQGGFASYRTFSISAQPNIDDGQEAYHFRKGYVLQSTKNLTLNITMTII